MKYVPWLLLLLTCCTSYKRCLDKYGQMGKDSVTTLVPFVLKVPGETAVYQLPVTAPLPDTVIVKGNARLIIRHDSIDRIIQAVCDTITITKTIEVKTAPIIHFSDTKKFYSFWPFWLIAGLCVLLLIALLRK